jgi:diadenosine tetraphosphate (Ap4A) HIT family hydrolase
MPTEQMEEKYSEGVLKEYSHWTLTISFRQTTLGSFIILAKRTLEQFSELKDEELIELRRVMKDIEKALQQAPDFKPDRLNYLQLGNSLHQLHFHGIPRYATPRRFAGQEWVDTRYGTPPQIVTKNEEAEVELVRQIKSALEPYIA